VEVDKQWVPGWRTEDVDIVCIAVLFVLKIGQKSCAVSYQAEELANSGNPSQTEALRGCGALERAHEICASVVAFSAIEVPLTRSNEY